jgi:DNA-binding beta-propeller fold protein YncE
MRRRVLRSARMTGPAARRVTMLATLAASALLGGLGGTAAAATGDLTQKAGTLGCISAHGACTSGAATDGVTSVVVSPDGTSAYAAASNSDAVDVFDRASNGTLTQKAGAFGCIANPGTGTGNASCTPGIALAGAGSVAISPDGTSVYVASSKSDAVVVFDRASNGTLTQKAGLTGCISQTGTGGLCTTGTALDLAFGATLNAVTVSPDGASVYVTAYDSGAVVVFDRGSNGALAQKPGAAGCISYDGTGGACTNGGGVLQGATSVTVSPDGTSVYATSFIFGAVLLFDRAANGTLTLKPGTAGCISYDGGGGLCTNGGSALQGAYAVAVSPDGASVYVSAYFANAVVVFDRAANGALTVKPGTAACVSDDGTGGQCATGKALNTPVSLAVSPDGESVYAASYISGAVDVFDRASNGALTQKPGTAGCISQAGTGGLCTASSFVLQGASGVTVSPDGTSVYLATRVGNAVAVFDREVAPTTVTYPDAVAADAPVGYWRLGESSGTTAIDSSGHANNGTYVNNPLLGVAGALVGDTNTAVRMDGVNDYVRVLDANTLDVGNTFTVEGWIKRSATTKAHDLLVKGMQVTIMNAVNGNQIWLRKPNVSTIARSTSGVPADGLYHHIVVTKSGSGVGAVKMYIDGAAVGVTDVSPAQVITNTTSTMSFAGAGSTSADYDELALYPTALSPGRITAHHTAGRPGI